MRSLEGCAAGMGVWWKRVRRPKGRTPVQQTARRRGKGGCGGDWVFWGRGRKGLPGTGAHGTSRASKVLTCVWIPWKAVLLWPQSFLTPFEMLLAFSEVSHFRTPNRCSENACQYINCVCSYEHLHLFSMNFEHAIGNYSHLLAENCSHDGLVQSCRTMSS